MSQEWNYFCCNRCYVMYPHLAVPKTCKCGNDLDSNSTRKKFFLTFKIEEFIIELKEKFCTGKEYDTIAKTYCTKGQHYYCDECKEIDDLVKVRLTKEARNG